MNIIADLHLHTIYSDGTATVEALLEQVLKTNIRTIAITDHDNLGAISHARNAASAEGIEIIAGVELSSIYKQKDVHLLGYYFDPDHLPLQHCCQQFRDTRESRALKILDKLKSLGMDMPMAKVRVEAGDGSIGRPHIARVMMECGFVKTAQEAFDKYIGSDKPAYIPKFKIDPIAAIQLIHEAGGLAVLAHPVSIGDDAIIPHLSEHGLDGLEVFHPLHQMFGRVEHYQQLAQKHNLLITGGSDWHGDRRPEVYIGKTGLNEDYMNQLRSAAGRHSGSRI